MLYDLALSYERANWARIDELAEGLGIPTNLLTSLYFSCMEEVNRVWNEITRPEPSQLEAGLAEGAWDLTGPGRLTENRGVSPSRFFAAVESRV